MVKTIKQIFFATLFISCMSHSALASTGLSGFNLQTFRPPSDGSGTFNLAGSKTLGHLKPHFGLISNVAGSLLKASNPVNTDTTTIVKTLLTTDVSASIGLSKFINVGIDAPVVFFENGRNYNTTNYFKTAAMGDLRADVKFKIINGIALLSSVSFPTGSRSKFTGTDGVSYHGKMIFDNNFKRLYLNTNVGYLAMKDTTVADVNIGDQFSYGLGASYALPVWKDSLSLTGEVFGSTVLKDVQKKTSPLEAIGGVKKRFENGLALELAGGRGILNAIGSPNYRVIAGLTYDLPTKNSSPAKNVQNNLETSSTKETVYFNFDSYELRFEAKSELDKIIEKIKQKGVKKIAVNGHADSVGPEKYNEHLSKLRAESVRKYILAKMKDLEIVVNFFGSKEPTDTNATRSGRAKNRRVEITY